MSKYNTEEILIEVCSEIPDVGVMRISNRGYLKNTHVVKDKLVLVWIPPKEEKGKEETKKKKEEKVEEEDMGILLSSLK